MWEEGSHDRSGIDGGDWNAIMTKVLHNQVLY